MHSKIVLLLLFSLILTLVSCKKSSVDSNEGQGAGDDRILFTKSYDTIAEIWSIKPDGTDPQLIARNNYRIEGMFGGYFGAKWSPDKDRIVITAASRRIDDYPSLWLMDNEGNLGSQLTSDGFGPNWSGDGNTILFFREGDCYTINVNSLSESLLLKADEGGPWRGGDWSSDGKYLLTHEERGSESELYQTSDDIVLLEISTREKTILSESDMNDFEAQWCPDESMIAFVSGRYGPGYQINLMNSDGSSETTLTDTLANYNSICWSPNGNKIVYMKQDKLEYDYQYAKGSDLFVLDINSRAITQLTHFNVDSIRVWSRDWK